MQALVSETLVDNLESVESDQAVETDELDSSLIQDESYRMPFLALLALIVALVLRPWDFIPVLASLKPITLMILGLLTLCATLNIRLDFFRMPLSRCLLAFWVIMMATSFTSYWVSSSLIYSIKYVQMLLLFAFMGTLIRSVSSLSTLTTTLVGVGALLGLYAIHAKLTSNYADDGRIRGVGTGFLGDPNDLAQALVTLLPLAWLTFYHGRNASAKVLGMASGLLMMAGIVITQSRGGLLALIGAFSVLMLITPAPLGKKVMIVALLSLATIAAIPAETWERYTSIAEAAQTDESAQTRLEIWKAGGRMFSDHLITGTGVNTFAIVYGQHYKTSNIGGNKWYTAHNSLIQIAVEAGLLGAITWTLFAFSPLWLLFCAQRRLRALQLEDPDPDRAWQHSALRGWCECMLAGMTGFLIAAMFLSRAVEVAVVLFVGISVTGYCVAMQWADESESNLESTEI